MGRRWCRAPPEPGGAPRLEEVGVGAPPSASSSLEKETVGPEEPQRGVWVGGGAHFRRGRVQQQRSPGPRPRPGGRADGDAGDARGCSSSLCSLLLLPARGPSRVRPP